jgi:hypothetical protein
MLIEAECTSDTCFPRSSSKGNHIPLDSLPESNPNSEEHTQFVECFTNVYVITFDPFINSARYIA